LFVIFDPIAITVHYTLPVIIKHVRLVFPRCSEQLRHHGMRNDWCYYADYISSKVFHGRDDSDSINASVYNMSLA